MLGGTLLVSRAKLLYPDIQNYLERAGFFNVNFTWAEQDSLNTKIEELKPKIVLIDCDFNQAATQFNVGEILNRHPKLNIAAFAVNNFPLTVSAWFIWYGAKSCLHLWADGLDEFNRGLREIKKGNEYISPVIQSILDLFPEWPETKDHVTRRQFECMILLCCGLNAEGIAREMHVSRRTIDTNLRQIFEVFHVHSKEELISFAWASGLVSREDLRFYRKDKYLKLPNWAYIKHRTNKKLEKIYERVYGC
jgi:two-component system invasion response regulator UvrY